MSSNDLEEMLRQNPDKPHRLILSSGDQVIIPNLRSVLFEGLIVEIIRFVSPDRLFVASRQRVSVPNIVLAEAIEGPPPPMPRRRRRK
jgi:hypothetical protein